MLIGAVLFTKMRVIYYCSVCCCQMSERFSTLAAVLVIMHRLMRKLNENIEIIGITLSAEESKHARRYMTAVHVVDLDVSDLSFLGERRFDAVIFSHVLEHVKDPQRLLTLSARQHLRAGGQVLIAVPNVLYYKNRLRLLTGHFEYEETGIMDRTHLHFFTWNYGRSLPSREYQGIKACAQGHRGQCATMGAPAMAASSHRQYKDR